MVQCETTQESMNFPINVDCQIKGEYKRDEHIQVSPEFESWSCDSVSSTRSNVIASYPYLCEFINFSVIAYEDQETRSSRENSTTSFNLKEFIKIENKVRKICNSVLSTGKVNILGKCEEVQPEDFSKLGVVPDGFAFLAEARNEERGNAYYGVAYINQSKRQIVLSHRGTIKTCWGAIKTDVKSVWWGSYTPQISSAITFANLVVQFARENGCQVFFTGHSLGAWLAQITCFSTKYLTVDYSTGHFVMKTAESWDELHPYTVGFDSPGALEFLQLMKNELFPRNDPQAQKKVKVACLPVEVFQFYPNTINKQNTQVGSVYLLNLDKAKVKYSYFRAKGMILGHDIIIMKSFVKGTHKKGPVLEMITKNGRQSESNVLHGKIFDWRIKEFHDDFLLKWTQGGKKVPVELNTFPEYFLTSKELELLVKQSDMNPEGAYEGLRIEDEEIGNMILKYARENMVFKNGTVQLGFNQDRRDVIPLLKHFTQTIEKGILWWNPLRRKLPKIYIPRKVQKHAKYVSALNASHFRVESIPLFEMSEDFFLLVDPPGMGKSSALTRLEQELRKQPLPRIILRVDLHQAEERLKSEFSKKITLVSFISTFADFIQFPDKILASGVTLLLILDGLDEISPGYQEKTLDLLEVLLLENEESNQVKLKIFLATRPHLRQLIEDKMKVEAHSLVPLVTHEQVKLLSMEVGNKKNVFTKTDAKKALKKLPTDLTSNPLMLHLYADVLSDSKWDKGKLNLFSLYSRFINKKHEEHWKRTSKDSEKHKTSEGTEFKLKQNLPFYSYLAAKELAFFEYLDEILTVDTQSVKSGGSTKLQHPDEDRQKKLTSYGIVTMSGGSQANFEHKSFAEFFYARLLLQEDTPQSLRDTLFSHIYARNGVLDNVEKFLTAAISNTTQGENTGSLELRITAKWLSIKENIRWGREILETFVSEKRLPTLIRQVLLAFVNGKTCEQWHSFCVLISSKNGFKQVFDWMRENREWTRAHMLNLECYCNNSMNNKNWSPASIWLIVAIATKFVEQDLLTETEVTDAIKTCDKFLATIAMVKTDGRNKWQFIKKYIGGEINFEDHLQEPYDEDFDVIVADMETVWKISSTVPHEKIAALIADRDTRVTDIVGRCPQEVSVAFGQEFIVDLANFRGKFGECKGKVVFELGGRDFALDFLWDQLVEEKQVGLTKGPVTLALREAIIGHGKLSWKFLELLECQSRKRCSDDSDTLINWIVKSSGSIWNQLTCFPLQILPFIIRYAGSMRQVMRVLQMNKSRISNESDLEYVLKSIILSSMHADNAIFEVLLSFLKDNLNYSQVNLNLIPGHKSIEVLMEAGKETLKAICPSWSYLVTEVSAQEISSRLTGGILESPDEVRILST